MEQLLPELVSYILGYLSTSDLKEASLVCKKWYYASLDPYLQRNVLFKCKLLPKDTELQSFRFGRKLTYISFGDEHSSIVSENFFTDLLLQCTNLKHLDLSFCNSLFLSGRLLSNEKQVNVLKGKLCTVKELKLSCLRHMTDVTFTRLVSIMENLESIYLASNNIIFNNGDPPKNRPAMISPAVFNFSTFLGFVMERATKIKKIDFSHTSVNDIALEKLSNVPSLYLTELILKGCIEVTDRGIKAVAENQNQLQALDISSCKSIGVSKSFFRTLVNNLSSLRVLKARKSPQLGQCDIQSLADSQNLHTVDIGEALNFFEGDLIKGLCSPRNHLSVVQLAYCADVSDKFVASLCQSNPGLQHLDLTSCRKVTDASLHSITRNLSSLQTLCLAYCHDITDLGLLGFETEDGVPVRHVFEHDHETCTCTRIKESLIFNAPKGILKQRRSYLMKAQTQLESGEQLLKLSNLTSLKSLDLSSCTRVTDLGVMETIKFQELTNLSLEYLPKLTDEAVACVVRSNPSLESVSLRGCGGLTDISVNSLCTHSPRLKSLNVAQNDKLTDASMDYLCSRSKRLKHLDISFCGNISYEASVNLEKSHPDLKLHFRPHHY